MRLWPTVCEFVAVGLILIAPSRTIATADSDATLALTSPAFGNLGRIPERFSCLGDSKSPALKWTGVPDGTRSFALIVEDPDAPIGTFVHWVVYNLSSNSTALPEGVSPQAPVGNGEQGTNGGGSIGYMGPCPPAGAPHHYHFRLFALDQKLALKAGATAQDVEAAMKGHVLGSAELVGIFQR
jgi:Raf kinase inhibitor-like YbhB/YbcL family protein